MLDITPFKIKWLFTTINYIGVFSSYGLEYQPDLCEGRMTSIIVHFICKKKKCLTLDVCLLCFGIEGFFIYNKCTWYSKNIIMTSKEVLRTCESSRNELAKVLVYEIWASPPRLKPKTYIPRNKGLVRTGYKKLVNFLPSSIHILITKI